MALTLEPLASTDAHAYWRVFIAGRSDLPADDLKSYMERYLALPPDEQRTHFAFREDGRIVGTIRIVGGATESPDANLSGFSIDPSRADLATAAIVKALDFLRAQGTTRISATFEDRYEPAFSAVGFRRWFARMRMVAPAVKRPLRGDILLQPPEETEILGLTKFFMDVYEGHLEQSYGMHAGPESDWRAYIGAVLKGESGRFMPDASFVALDGGRLVGAILVTHWMGAPLVSEIGVAKDRRGKGLGAALLQGAMNRLADLGEDRVALFVTLGNDNAIALYERLGFAQAGGRAITARFGEDSQA